MAENKKRKGHPYRKPADIPTSQRVKGSTVWALLLAAFALLIAYFAAGPNFIILAIATVAGGLIGYFIGRKLEKGSF